jgi:hypothetical protein
MAAGWRFEGAPATVQALVRSACEHVLGSSMVSGQQSSEGGGVLETNSAETLVDMTSSAFYTVWGNLIPAAQLAEFYGRFGQATGGAGLSMEDMITHPSMLAQAVLLAERMGVKQGPLGKSVEKKKKQKSKTMAVVLTTVREAVVLPDQRRDGSVGVGEKNTGQGKRAKRLPWAKWKLVSRKNKA